MQNQDVDLLQQLMMGVGQMPQDQGLPAPMMTPQMQAMQQLPIQSMSVTKKTRMPAATQDPAAPIMNMISPQKSSYSEVLNDLMRANATSIDSQKAGIAQLEEQYKKMGSPQLDPVTAAIFGASDLINNTQYVAQAQGKQENEKAKQMMFGQQLQKSRSDLSDKEIDLLRAQAQFAKGEEQDKLEREKMDIMEKLGWARIAADKQKPEPDLKDAQVLSATYGKRLQQAEDVFADLEKQGYDRTSRKESLLNMLPGEFASEPLRRQSQAERNFINAILRRESGAAIAKSEFESAERQYFPRPGDTPEVLAQKRANRQQSIEGMKLGAGRAWDQLPQVSSEIGTGTRMGTSAPSDTKEWQGKTYKKQGNKWVEVK